MESDLQQTLAEQLLRAKLGSRCGEEIRKSYKQSQGPLREVCRAGCDCGLGESSGLISKPISVSQTVFITGEMCLTLTVVGWGREVCGPL